MRVGVVLLCALLWATPRAAAGDSVGLHVAIGALLAADGADLSTSMYAIGSGAGREVNPAFVPFAKTPALAGAVKMGLAAVPAFALLRLHATHPRLALWLAVAGTLGYSALAAHNAALAR